MNDRNEVRIRAYADQRGFKPGTLARWLEHSDDDAVALLELAAELRLGENQLLGVWTWSEEIALRDGLRLAEVLKAAEVQAIVQSSLGRNDKLERLRTALRRRRYPELTQAEETLSELVSRLNLPREVRVTWPPFLEGEDLRIEIVVRDPAGLARAAAALATAAATPEIEEIFDLL